MPPAIVPVTLSPDPIYPGPQNAIMFIEGVNLLLTERTEIGAILDSNKGDIDALIAELKRLS